MLALDPFGGNRRGRDGGTTPKSFELRLLDVTILVHLDLELIARGRMERVRNQQNMRYNLRRM